MVNYFSQHVETAEITHDAPTLPVTSVAPFFSRAAQAVSPAVDMTLKNSDVLVLDGFLVDRVVEPSAVVSAPARLRCTGSKFEYTTGHKGSAKNLGWHIL